VARTVDRRQRLGSAGERAAEEFLKRKRYTVLRRNYRCKSGEVDLVAVHRGTLVFVEVKTRRDESCGSPFEAVDRRKQQRLIRAARQFIAEHDLYDRNARFDVVAVWEEAGRRRCEVLEDAFELGAGVWTAW